MRSSASGSADPASCGRLERRVWVLWSLPVALAMVLLVTLSAKWGQPPAPAGAEPRIPAPAGQPSDPARALEPPPAQADPVRESVAELSLSSPDAFSQSCERLAAFGDEAVVALLERMHFDDPYVSEGHALGMVGAPEAEVLQGLISMLESQDEGHEYAAWSLTRLGEQDPERILAHLNRANDKKNPLAWGRAQIIAETLAQLAPPPPPFGQERGKGVRGALGARHAAGPQVAIDPTNYFQADVEYAATLENCERHIMATEYREGWNEIHWRRNVDHALGDAGKTGVPIVVFFYLEEFHAAGPT